MDVNMLDPVYDMPARRDIDGKIIKQRHVTLQAMAPPMKRVPSATDAIVLGATQGR